MAKTEPASQELAPIDVMPPLPKELQGFEQGEEIKRGVMQISNKKAFYVKINSTIKMKKITDIFNGGKVDRPFLEVTDLETGAEELLILPATLLSTFESLGAVAVGKSYAVYSLGKGNKPYNQYKVVELKKKHA